MSKNIDFSKDQIRIQRLEKKITKLKNRNKNLKEEIDFYKKLLKYTPVLEWINNLVKKNFEYCKVLDEAKKSTKDLENKINYLKKPNITFEKFISTVDKEYSYKKFMRYGQTLMNVLWEVWPDEYSRITASKNDCFYDDSKIELVKNELKKKWI